VQHLHELQRLARWRGVRIAVVVVAHAAMREGHARFRIMLDQQGHQRCEMLRVVHIIGRQVGDQVGAGGVHRGIERRAEATILREPHERDTRIIGV